MSVSIEDKIWDLLRAPDEVMSQSMMSHRTVAGDLPRLGIVRKIMINYRVKNCYIICM